MRKILYLILIASFFSCNQTNNTGENTTSGFRISGRITHAVGIVQLNEFTSSGLLPLDSAVIKPDGQFLLEGKLPEKTFCVLRFPKGDIVLLSDTNSQIHLEIDADSIEAYKIEGGNENDQLRTIFLMNHKAEMAVRKLYTENILIYGEGVPPNSVKEKYQNSFDSIVAQSRKDILGYADAIQHSIVPYFVTNFLMIEPDYTYFRKTDSLLYNQFSDSKYAQFLHNRVTDLSRTAIGAEAPDIVMNDPFGKQVALSSLRGKYVLLDFWASWCGPCKEEIPHVVSLYNKYKSRGFEVFSVSLDDNREAWEKAINQNKMLWTHASDLMKWNSPIVSQYNIEAIPYMLLLDKDGHILSSNIRGEELEQKLKEIFAY